MLFEAYFLYPSWLFFFLPLLLWYFRYKKIGLVWAKFIPPLGLRFPPLLLNINQSKTVRSEAALMITSFALGLIVVALAQPVIKGDAIDLGASKQPLNIILLVGTPITMVLSDYKIEGEIVSRMAMTKRVLKQFVTEFTGEKIALVVMGAPSSTWLPLTSDKRLMIDAIDRLRVTMGGRLSDLGGGLKLIADEFNGNQYETAVLLFSDGGLQRGAVSPQQGAKLLADNKIKLHSIAIGQGQQLELSRKGGLLYNPVDLGLMGEVSSLTGGSLYSVNDLDSMLTALEKVSSSLVNKAADKDGHFQQLPLYPWLLLLATFFLAAQQFLFKIFTKQGSI